MGGLPAPLRKSTSVSTALLGAAWLVMEFIASELERVGSQETFPVANRPLAVRVEAGLSSCGVALS